MKANQQITHHARLREAEEPLRRFLEAVAPLGERLGPVLFQCPPSLRYDPGVLDDFLDSLGRGERRFAMEFRHPSFDSDEVREKLAAAGVAWCVADTEEAPARFVRTANDFAYVRLRQGGYEGDALAGWARAFGEALEAGTDVYAYLKHEDSATGPRDAAALAALAVPE